MSLASRSAVPGLRSSLPLLSLLAAAALLALALRIPPAFEDGYHHWLIAANLAQAGRFHDPLFGMEDTWLPGYHLAAAAVLRLAGLRNLEALRLFSVFCALLTLALLFRLAGGGVRGAVSVLLLALNPIFLLTATSVAAEPLLVVLALGASIAGLEGRRAAAALLAVAACLVGTKAWLWLVAIAVSIALRERLPAPARWRLAAWCVPALLLAAGIEFATSPGAHSLARASTEAVSAAARGGVPSDRNLRGVAFLGYFALASAALLLPAAMNWSRESRSVSGRRCITFIHLPALLYLAMVAILVFAGAYSGSHRYLYPALPALALLAAGALEAVGRLPMVAGVAAAMLTAVAFIPVLQSFGALNGGLLRAGTAAGRLPGGLLTDSPAAAYASGKAPSAIHGSRELPPDSMTALEFLLRSGIGSLVLEDIPYYHVNSVFPGLAAGAASPPFIAVGSPSAYAVAGGKPAAVYRLGGQVFLSSAPGTGKTAALARGAVLSVGGRPLSGEGLGFGTPLVRYPDGDWFAGTSTVTGAPDGWRTVFELDRRGVDDDRSFVQAPSRGEVAVSYRVIDGGLSVSVTNLSLTAGYREVVVLNEESAAFDDYADASHTLIGPAVGSWREVGGDWARFRSSRLGLEWSMPAVAGAAFHAAREQRSPDLDFSGLEYSFAAPFAGVDYTIKVRDAG